MQGSAEVSLEDLSGRDLVQAVCSELPYGLGIVPQGDGVEPLRDADPYPADEAGHPCHLSSDCTAPLLHILGFRLGADVDPRHTERARDAGIGGAEPDGCAKRQKVRRWSAEL